MPASSRALATASSRENAPRLFSITWPFFSEHLLQATVGLLFVWLTARISDGTAAAFALSNQVMVTFVMLFRIVAVGASVVVTQYLGAGDGPGAQRIARASLGAAMWSGAAVASVVALGAGPLLTLMKLPGELRPQAQPYLMLLGIVLFAESLITTLGSVLRAYTHTRQTMRLVVLMNVLGMACGLPLLYGWLGLPKLGLVGVGVGLLAARLWTLVCYFALWRRLLGITPTGEDFWRLRRGSLGEMMHIGLPGAGENIAYRISFTMILALVANMGQASLVTHTYLLQITHFVLLVGLAVGFGTEIVVGHMVGAGQLTSADRLVRRALAVGLTTSISLGLVVGLCGRTIFGFFTSDPAIIESGSKLVWLILLLEPGRSFNIIVINGLRATGDARFPVLYGVFSMYLVAFGLAWLLGVHSAWGLAGIWLAFAADEWLRGLSMYVRWRRLGWVKYARRARRRILSQRPGLASQAESETTVNPALTNA